MQEEKDYLMRQIKQIAQSLGYFLSIGSIKDLINLGADSNEHLTDQEIETILLVTQLQGTIESNDLSSKEVEAETGLNSNDIDMLDRLERELTEEESDKIISFIDKHAL